MKWFLRFTKYLRWTGFMQIKMVLTRVEATEKGIFGHLDVDESFSCVTLENDELEIPLGTYKVTLYESPANKALVPLLHDVPNRSMIEIHAGNYESNSKGCILVGKNRNGFAIENSKVTLAAIVEKLKKADEIWITIK